MKALLFFVNLIESNLISYRIMVLFIFLAGLWLFSNSVLLSRLIELFTFLMLFLMVKQHRISVRNYETILLEAREYRELFHNTHDAIFLQKLGTREDSGLLIEVNNVACRLLGYTREQLLTMTPRDFMGTQIDSEENFPEFWEELTEDGQVTFEWSLSTQNGSELPVEIRARRFMLGQKDVVLSVVRDHTERRSRKKLLIHSQEQIDLINVQDISLITRSDRKTIIHTIHGTVETNDSLQKISEQISDRRLFRCHKGFIINTEKVTHLLPWGHKTYLVKLSETDETALMTHEKLKVFEAKYC